MTNQLDERGFYILQKHVVVRFILNEIIDVELAGFNGQNVLFDLTLHQNTEGYGLHLDPCYGLGGSITAKRLSIELESAPKFLVDQF